MESNYHEKADDLFFARQTFSEVEERIYQFRLRCRQPTLHHCILIINHDTNEVVLEKLSSFVQFKSTCCASMKVMATSSGSKTVLPSWRPFLSPSWKNPSLPQNRPRSPSRLLWMTQRQRQASTGRARSCRSVLRR